MATSGSTPPRLEIPAAPPRPQVPPGHGRRDAGRLADEVFHDIASRIVHGDYPPGSRINDRALAIELGVSRTPVREAMLRLERIGLVAVHPSRFTMVTEITEEMARSTWEFSGLYAGNIVRLAFPHLSQEARAHALTLIEAAATTVDSPTEWLSAHIALFSFLAERSGNELYRTLLGDSWYLVLRNLIHVGIPDGATASFRALARAIIAEDREAAERAARRVFGVD
ncbi:GntR family transcriptional regulator [Microbacterium sp. XT11]|uniref:GntR family transcriptional regulator n=1 Tax=Microbacterium sp. XT11 TaxID=367477 RepID=UPI000A3F4763|nr:GntR family transcriptional regulator [Microbacterium sp. XT11]